MKKLLSVLFILGSVASLANDSASVLPADVDPAFCFSKPCSAEDKFTVNVKVPEQLVIKVDDVDFGLWCGTKTVTKDFPNKVHVTGESDQTVKLGFKNNGNLTFVNGLSTFGGKVAFAGGAAEEDVVLAGGAANTALQVTVNKPHIVGLLNAGQTYKAYATVVGSYDGF